MRLNPKQKKVLLSAGRALLATVISFAAVWLAGPEAASIIPASYQVPIATILIPVLASTVRSLMYGAEAEEDPNEALLTLNRGKN